MSTGATYVNTALLIVVVWSDVMLAGTTGPYLQGERQRLGFVQRRLVPADLHTVQTGMLPSQLPSLRWHVRVVLRAVMGSG